MAVTAEQIVERAIAEARPTSDGCLIATSWSVHESGYIRVTLGKRKVGLHRVLVEVALERHLAPDETVDHECHNRALIADLCPGGTCVHRRCIAIDHLAVKSRAENFAAGPGLIRARANACLNGHEMTPVNTLRFKDGRRRCRSCGNARAAGRDPRLEPLTTSVRPYRRH